MFIWNVDITLKDLLNIWLYSLKNERKQMILWKNNLTLSCIGLSDSLWFEDIFSWFSKCVLFILCKDWFWDAELIQ